MRRMLSFSTVIVLLVHGPSGAGAQLPALCSESARSITWKEVQARDVPSRRPSEDSVRAIVRALASNHPSLPRERTLLRVRKLWQADPDGVERELGTTALAMSTTRAVGAYEAGWLYKHIPARATTILDLLAQTDWQRAGDAFDAVAWPVDSTSQRRIFVLACDAAWRIFQWSGDSVYGRAHDRIADVKDGSVVISRASELLSGQYLAALESIISQAYDRYGLIIDRWSGTHVPPD